MIACFTGTGNSWSVAQGISFILDDDDPVININHRLMDNDFSAINPFGTLVLVTPTYGWRIPRVVSDWMRMTAIQRCDIWFVMTCGGEIGNAAKYNKKLCEELGLYYRGTMQIFMPENYIAMFDTPEWTEAKKIVLKAQPDIWKAAEYIRDNKDFDAPRNNILDRIKSDLVNPIFYKFCVKADPFFAKENCVGCGQCVASCPLNNIQLKDGKPVWGKNCTHCMACISFCPKEAIEYGNKSQGKPRYYLRREDEE